MDWKTNMKSTSQKSQVSAIKRKPLVDLLRIQILEEEVEYFKTLIQPHDTGHIYTTISFIQERIRHLKGEQKGWPFD